MEITREQSGDSLELKIKGRLDGYWADHLSTTLEEVIREGAHQVRLNLAEVSYLSSAGIRVLVMFYKQLKSIQGSFAIASPSESVRKVLELAGLSALLVSGAPPAQTVVAPAAAQIKRLERESAIFEIFPGGESAHALKCRVVGEPELLVGCRFRQPSCRSIAFPDSTFAVGLGAFGNDFEDCRDRFGEFLAVAGAAAYLPTDGTNTPDYLIATRGFVPELKVLYCIAGEGQFAQLARFEAKKEAGAVALSEVVDACLEIGAADTVGIVMLAESAGLVGAALRRSPAVNGSKTAPYEHPEIREWLSFTAERAHVKSLALVVGVAARKEQQALLPVIRPLGREPWPAGHFHAAAFSYRPLKKGEIDLRSAVSTVFESATLRDVLHLLNDDREISGAGQSEFFRGACWIGPVAEVIRNA